MRCPSPPRRRTIPFLGGFRRPSIRRRLLRKPSEQKQFPEPMQAPAPNSSLRPLRRACSRLLVSACKRAASHFLCRCLALRGGSVAVRGPVEIFPEPNQPAVSLEGDAV